jgi:hypothetical protein
MSQLQEIDPQIAGRIQNFMRAAIAELFADPWSPETAVLLIIIARDLRRVREDVNGKALAAELFTGENVAVWIRWCRKLANWMRENTSSVAGIWRRQRRSTCHACPLDFLAVSLRFQQSGWSNISGRDNLSAEMVPMVLVIRCGGMARSLYSPDRLRYAAAVPKGIRPHWQDSAT